MLTNNTAVLGEAEEDGYEDEYQLEDVDITPVDYVKALGVPNFRKAWEDLEADFELEHTYTLGDRDNLQAWRL